MLSYPSFKVNGATRVGALRLPLEVYLLLGLGVSVGHCGLVDDIFGVAVTRGLPAGPLNGLPTGPFAAGTQSSAPSTQ